MGNKNTFQTKLNSFDNSWYKPGGNSIKRLLWFYTNAIIFNSHLFPSSQLKCFLLKSFGAKIGKGVNIKPAVNIKYPWRLKVGDYSWIGEHVWIDNLDNIVIGSHVCISQGAMLLCGNHDFKTESFNLVTKEIILDEGVWIGAKSTVCPGVTCFSHSILTVGSVATKNLEPFSIYQGNPAVKVKNRINQNQQSNES